MDCGCHYDVCNVSSHFVASLKKAAGQFGAPALAILLNTVMVPLLAWPLSFCLNSELGYGLIVAAAAPCTLASAAVWTRRAGGNDSVAILVTIVTNSLCFVITPMWVYLLIGRASDSLEQVDFSGTIWKLLLLVVCRCRWDPLGCTGDWILAGSFSRDVARRADCRRICRQPKDVDGGIVDCDGTGGQHHSYRCISFGSAHC